MSHGTNGARKMLLATLAGHFAWLAEAHPRKAASPKAQRARRWVVGQLRSELSGGERKRKAA